MFHTPFVLLLEKGRKVITTTTFQPFHNTIRLQHSQEVLAYQN